MVRKKDIYNNIQTSAYVYELLKAEYRLGKLPLRDESIE